MHCHSPLRIRKGKQQSLPHAQKRRLSRRSVLRTGNCLVLLSFLAWMTGCNQTNSVPPEKSEETSGTIPTDIDTQPSNPQPSPSNQSSALDREKQLAEADQCMEAGNYNEANSLLTSLLLINPNDSEVLFRIANSTAAEGDLLKAVTFLNSISPDDLEAGLPALGQAADWYAQLKLYAEAENRYRRLLKIAPQASIAHRRLALLLNRQGRRHEAAVHLRELCKIGDIRQDELHALIVLSDAMGGESPTQNQPAGDPSSVNDPTDDVDYSPINDWGRSRILFTQRKYAEAASLLNADGTGVKKNTSAEPTEVGEIMPASIVAFQGRVLAEAQNDTEFKKWLMQVENRQDVQEYAEYWAAIGTYLASRQKHEQATHAFLNALDRDPTDFRSINRLHQMLEQLGRTEQAERWEARWKANREILLANNAISASNNPNVDAMNELASQLSGVGRKLEAVLWKMLESYHRGADQEILNHWNQQLRQLVESKDGFPSTLVRLCDMNQGSFSAPQLDQIREPVSDSAQPRDTGFTLSEIQPQMMNVANSVGLIHRFQPASAPLESGFAMYHQAGGGVAVLDYDLDGSADLYFAQGAADSPDFMSKTSNPLFRNLEAQFSEVTQQAEASEYAYTIGCTSGDWNQDGFPDLVTANIGTNRILINNGDGTYRAESLSSSKNLQTMPASIAIADLNQDGLPDLYEANYIEDAKIDLRPDRDANGNVIEAVGPADFAPARDRIGIRDADGKIVFETISETPSSIHRGLGVVIADFDQKKGNDVFVGNDKSPNQLWTFNSQSLTWADVAMPLGVAYSFDGGGTASMGIAAGDFDHSGSLDLHIANFQNESACLYLAQSESFQDRAAQFRLGVPSYEVLGFGSQSIDFNNDGLLDLAVTNGHIDNYQKMSGPFMQRFQLFRNTGNRFEELIVNDASEYLDEGHLGRAMARLDFNNDGRDDLVITHLNEPSALLKNQTSTQNHWLQVQLVGTKSERDAIGAMITVFSDQHQSTQWIVGGDGYLCRNQALASFGLGTSKRIEKVEIQWPSGQKQVIKGLELNRRIIVIENIDQWHAFIE